MLTDVGSEGGQRHPTNPSRGVSAGIQESPVGFQEKGLLRWKLSEKQGVRQERRRCEGPEAARAGAPGKG